MEQARFVIVQGVHQVPERSGGCFFVSRVAGDLACLQQQGGQAGVGHQHLFVVGYFPVPGHGISEESPVFLVVQSGDYSVQRVGHHREERSLAGASVQLEEKAQSLPRRLLGLRPEAAVPRVVMVHQPPPDSFIGRLAGAGGPAASGGALPGSGWDRGRKMLGDLCQQR